MAKLLHFSVWGRIVTAVLLFWALDRHSYGYYTLLRWITCGVSAYFAYVAYENGKTAWAWILGIMTLIFNPIIPFHLKRDTWHFIDFVSGILMTASIFFVKVDKRLRNGSL